MFEEYSQKLDSYRGLGDNYWSDFLVLEAIDAIDRFAPEDWNTLKNSIDGNSDDWCYACAETLSEAIDSQHAIPLLLVLVKHKNRDVKVIALDSLRGQISKFKSIDNFLKNEIQTILKNHIPEGNVEKISTYAMKKKLSEFP